MRILPALSLAASLLVSTVASATEIITPISSSEMTEAATNGPIVVGERGTPNRGQVIGLVQAPVEAVVRIIADIDNHEAWYPDTTEAELISGDSTSNVGRGVTAVPIVRDRTWTINGAYEVKRMSGIECHALTYELVPGSGNMEELNGYWLVCPYGDTGYSMVKYVIIADLGVWLPSGVVNWATRRMLPGIISGLQERYQALNP